MGGRKLVLSKHSVVVFEGTKLELTHDAIVVPYGEERAEHGPSCPVRRRTCTANGSLPTRVSSHAFRVDDLRSNYTVTT